MKQDRITYCGVFQLFSLYLYPAHSESVFVLLVLISWCTLLKGSQGPQHEGCESAPHFCCCPNILWAEGCK